jgi:hypothetical protein
VVHAAQENGMNDSEQIGHTGSKDRGRLGHLFAKSGCRHQTADVVP